ncbi:MAG: hypothetical protein KDH94_06975, partial [Coxiellaceae bacterium]|nr:hypothetical protein [Coxiellaceae bacterium]
MRTEPVPSIDKNNIHFIWFGAAMHAKAVDTVKQWRAFLDAVQKAHDTKFEISIWVDKVGSSPEAIKQMEQEFAGIATLRDVTELGFSDDIVRYQIDRLRPNYAASSDVVRFRILKKERGLYLDTDIVPPTSIDHFMKAWSHDDVIMPNQFAAQQGILNSDVIFYNGKNPHSFIDYMVDETVKNYDVKAQDSSLSRKSQHRYKLAAAPESSAWRQAYLQETDQHRLEYTLRVGSSLLMSDWLEQQFQATGGPAQNIEDMVKRAGYTLVAESDLRTPLDQTGSDLSWRGRPVIQLDTVDEAVARAIATMQFEVEHQGVLRLDDHLMN